MIDEAVEPATVGTNRQVVRSRSAVDALVRLERGSIDGVVIDAPLPDFDIGRFVEAVGRTAPDIPIVVVGDWADLDSVEPADETSITAVLPASDGLEAAIDRVAAVVSSDEIDRAVARVRRLRELTGEVARLALSASMRDEIEAGLYDLISSSGLYRFAWIGKYSAADDRFELRWPQQGEFSVAAVTALLGVDDPGFLARSVSGSAVEVAEGHLDTRSAAASRADEASVGNAEASLVVASVPIVNEGAVSGLLLLVTAAEDQISGAEREYLGELGEVVGDALLAVDERTGTTELDVDRTRRVAELFAHQLRNPLSVASMYLEIGRDEDDPEAFDRVEAALERIDHVIDGVLRVSRPDVTLQRSTGDLGEDAETAWGIHGGADATLEVADSIRFEADHDLVVQLLANLFENAIDHAGEGVTVRLGRCENGFFVEDTGPGIPTDRRDSVFEWGYSSTDGGTGLGLAVVREIARAHGWNVQVKEAAGGGARIEVRGIEEIDEE